MHCRRCCSRIGCRVEGLLPLALHLLKILCWFAIAAFIAVAAFDLWFQKWEFLRRNRMSIEEVRREHKEVEAIR